ncbi:MAG: hypothetical protein WC748_05215 [Legionellales bacterium]
MRVISLGALRIWDDLFWPTVTTLITMTVMAIPAGYGVSKLEDDWS